MVSLKWCNKHRNMYEVFYVSVSVHHKLIYEYIKKKQRDAAWQYVYL